MKKMKMSRTYKSDRANIKEVLEELGFKLNDKGNYWQSTARYRDGDNETALQIFKNSGGWKDYVTGETGSFRALIEKCIGKSSNKGVSGLVADVLSGKESIQVDYKPSGKIEMEKIYEESFLHRLLPHYTFYNEKGISDATLKDFKGGLATKGNMYQRFVFPIYNHLGQIHGFAGRDMGPPNKDRPKWKQMGKKTDWIYPFHTIKDCKESILEGGDVILIESVGDALALYERGYRNIMVIFGSSISSKQICFVNSISPKRIIIATNNDRSKKNNPGLISALKAYLSLISFFDPNQVYICLPKRGDFGDFDDEVFYDWEKKLDKLDYKAQIPIVVEQLNKYNKIYKGKTKLIGDSLLRKARKLERML